MAKVTTARILADKALQMTCDQQCVDWAITMLEEGRDGHYLLMLAGMLPPHNHFELADLRDRSLVELAIPDLDPSSAVRIFAAERLRTALAGEAGLIETLGIIKDLCVAQNYQKELYDFYLLYEAYVDLRDSQHQWYWEGASRENIGLLIRQRAEQFLLEFPERI
jgi:hypothetical protein